MRAVRALVTIVALAPFAAWAQTRSVDVNFLRPALFSDGIFTVERATPSARWRPGFRFAYSFESQPLRLDFPQQAGTCPGSKCLGRQTIVDNAHVFYLQAQLGIARWLELAVELPLVRESLTTDVGQGYEALARADLQTNIKPPNVAPLDVRVGAKCNLLNVGGLSLAMALQARIPFGDERAFAGDRSFVIEPDALLSYERGIFSLALNAGFRYRQRTIVMWDDPDTNEGALPLLSVGSEIALGVGTFFRVHRLLGFGAEFVAAVPVSRGDVTVEDRKTTFDPVIGPQEQVTSRNISPASATVAEALGGLTVTPRPGLGISLAAGAGVMGAERRTALRVFASIGWVAGGAPVAKSTDRDGDQIPDSQDQCPDEPEDRDGYQDDDGCPDLDNDGDGVPDLNDKCPNEAEDKDGFEDEDGCPDPDNDGDGILDGDDKCPNEPEDKDGFQDEDGCPDQDNDGDGIADKDDMCPNEPETVNGFQDEDGCPDTVPGPAVVDKGKIITEKIAFGAGAAKLTKESTATLDQVAKILRSSPQIGRVRIEGHCDDAGSPAANQKLSQERAEAVMDYLVRKGVRAERLQAVGYGSSRPIASNKTPAGRTKNRRVEFIVIQSK
jgi:large repetitive protein